MSHGNSPFSNRSGLTSRSPPPTPSPLPAPAPSTQEEAPPKSLSTGDLQGWMQSNGANSDQKNREKQDLSQRIQELKQCIEESTKPSPEPVTFADLLKKNTRFVQPSNISSVAIYPTDKQKSSEETKSLVQQLIRSEEMKLHVRGLRKVKNGGVVISTDSKDVLKLKQSTQLTTSGLTVDEPQKRKPRIVVVGVPATMEEAEVFKCIYHQNLAGKMRDTTLEKFLSSTKLSHKSGKKN